jgi:hypothetical protein
MADESTERSNQPIGNPQAEILRSTQPIGTPQAITGYDTTSTTSKDASQDTVVGGNFNTNQNDILGRMVELTRDQNPDWVYVYASSTTSISDDYCIDTMLDMFTIIVTNLAI